jgi:hypothetical protein
MLTNEQIAWMAGIADGEGSFFITYTHDRNGCGVFKCSFAVGNTNRAILEEVQRVFRELTGKEFSLCPIKARGNRKTSWVIQLTAQSDLRRFCECVLPYLVGKHAQAELMIEFVKHCPGAGRTMTAEQIQRRFDAMLEMKRLNRYRTGDVPSPARDLTGSSPQLPSVEMMEKSALHSDMQSTAEMPVPSAIN